MNQGDLVSVCCSERLNTWAYKGNVYSADFPAPGDWVPHGTVGILLGPSDPRFGFVYPKAVLIDGQIWTIPGNYLQIFHAEAE